MAAVRAPDGGRNYADLMRVDAAWAAECMHADRRIEAIDACTVAGSAARALDVVDAAMAAATRYVPLLPDRPHDHRFLLHLQPRAGLAAGALTLAADPVAAAERALPPQVLALLRAEAGHLALAGSAALSAVSAAPSTPGDYDLFAYGFSGSADEISAAAGAMLSRIMASKAILGGAKGISVTRCAVTFRVAAVTDEAVVQVVLRAAADPADVILRFDLPPCKVLLTYLPGAEGPKLACLASPDWSVTMRHLAYPVSSNIFTRSGPLRIIKYQAKGFDAMIPRLADRELLPRALRRPAARSTAQLKKGRHALRRLDGWPLLMSLESAVIQAVAKRREPRGWGWRRQAAPVGPARVQPADVASVARAMWCVECIGADCAHLPPFSQRGAARRVPGRTAPERGTCSTCGSGCVTCGAR